MFLDIENEMLREHYDRETTTQGGPLLKIDGVQAVWSNWEFESVGPTSHLLGGVSSQKDNRLWIGQWMHIDFPNATHTPDDHTIEFEWPNEDFTGKETNFQRPKVDSFFENPEKTFPLCSYRS